MAVLVYCITGAEVPINLPQQGLDGAPIRHLSASGLRCFVSDHSDQGPESKQQIRDSAVAFHAILQAFLRQTAIIPFRFPTLLRDEQELIAFLQEHDAEYHDTLVRIRGMVQMELRLTVDEAEAEIQSSSGTAYLRSRQAHYRKFDRISTEVLKQIESLTCQHTAEYVSNGARLFFLVPGDAIEAFVSGVREVTLPANVSARITGPWPPTEFLKGSDGK